MNKEEKQEGGVGTRKTERDTHSQNVRGTRETHVYTEAKEERRRRMRKGKMWGMGQRIRGDMRKRSGREGREI